MFSVSGQSRGFGFVQFKEMAAVDWVLSNPHHSIKDKVVEVKRAVPKLDAAPGPVGYQGYDATAGFKVSPSSCTSSPKSFL